MKFEGEVYKRPYAPGSKSERPAVMIRLEQGEFLLQRVGGNPFRDNVLEDLVGKTIRCDGTLRETALLMTDWEEVED